MIEGQNTDRKFHSQAIEPSSTLTCKVDTETEGRSNNVDVFNSNSNMPDYFRSCAERHTKRPLNVDKKTN